MTEIRQIIEKAAIHSNGEGNAIRIFRSAGQAEAEIHNMPIEQVHLSRSRRPRCHG